MTKAPSSNAVTALLGMPSESTGMRLPATAALLADSGPATPSIAPLPKRSGWGETRFSSAYDMNEAVTGPPPGTRPRMKPSPLPRSIARHEARQSARVGHRPVMRSARSVLGVSVSTLTSTSATPNRPMTTARSSTPPLRSTEPNVKRSRPLTTSMPTAAVRKPSATISTPFTAEPDRRRRDRRREEGHHHHTQGAGDERADRRDAERGAGAALSRHLVAVDAGHHRGGLAGNVQQDRRGRSAVHRAVEDRREHHHAADRRHGERHRQQQRQRGERADA